jgi:hypothetical protein
LAQLLYQTLQSALVADEVADGVDRCFLAPLNSNSELAQNVVEKPHESPKEIVV